MVLDKYKPWRCRHIFIPVGEIRWARITDPEVWYVGDLSGIITIPGTDGHGLSGWTLFTAGGQGVPDGGTTVDVARCSAQCARHGPTLHKELTGYGPDSVEPKLI